MKKAVFERISKNKIAGLAGSTHPALLGINQAMTEVLGYRIEHKMVGGQHLFTSPDLPGLYVAHAEKPAIVMLREMAARQEQKRRFGAMAATS